VTDDEKPGPGRIAAAIVSAVLAVACFAVAVMIAVSPHHHALRIVGSLLAGLVFLAAAWFALRYRSLALEEAREAEAAEAGRAAQAQAAKPAGAQQDTEPMSASPDTEPMDITQA
jgi:hypothetical protein